jgi:hypothetical protein
MSIIVFIKHRIGVEQRGEAGDWTIYIDGEKEILAQIKKVEYALKPGLIFEGKGKNFECRALSPFNMNIEVKFYIGTREPVTTKYYITTNKSNQEGQAVTID